MTVTWLLFCQVVQFSSVVQLFFVVS
jgi:hypothetical protein